MASQAEVRFAALLRGQVEKVKWIGMLTSESEEAAVYAALEELAVDLNLMIEEGDPKRAIVGKMITDQVGYYKATRVVDPNTGLTSAGKTTRSRQATAGHVAEMLEKIYPILEVSPQVLVREVEVPRTAASTVPVPAPSEAPEKKGLPWGWILGGGAALFLATTFLPKKNPQRRRR